MTMPHLMNCRHSEDGWCLACVEKLQHERDQWAREAQAARLMDTAFEAWFYTISKDHFGRLRHKFGEARRAYYQARVNPGDQDEV